MSSDRKKIDETLSTGETILLQKPEIKDIPYNQILDTLDDGTQEMMHNRWGVLAQVIINSITCLKSNKLIEYLAQIDCPDLACEYVGYALQAYHGVALEELLVVAEENGLFDKIVKFVGSNLQHKERLDINFLLSFLETLELHRSHHSYYSILHSYAVGIAACDGFIDVVKLLDPIVIEAQYDLLHNLRRHWFAQKPNDANAQIRSFLNQNSKWAWKLGIDYCEQNLCCDKFTLEQYYPQIEDLVNKDNDLKDYAIPMFVEYILQTFHEKDRHPKYNIITLKLRQLLKQSPVGVLKFLQKIEYQNNYPEDIMHIFRDILSTPTRNTAAILNHLDTCFLLLLEKEDYQSILRYMLEFFSSNKFRVNYLSFFDALDSTLPALSKHTVQITDLAFSYIASANLDRLFFGLGLLIKLGNIKELYRSKIESSPDYSGSFDAQQLIRIMKAVLYCAVDDNKICHTAFLLLYLAKSTVADYINFCMDSVFYDFPIKLYDISKSYLNSDIPSQAKLARLVEESYIARETLLKKSQNIPDLYPSHEHQVIYHRALQEQSRQISKNANKISVLNDLFSRSVLKFGCRSGHTIRGSQNQQFYQSNPYHEFRCEYHLPVTYLIDPVEYLTRRIDFLQEAKENASNN